MYIKCYITETNSNGNALILLMDKKKEILITSFAGFRINIYNFIKKYFIYNIICQKMCSVIVNIFKFVQLDQFK